MSINNNYNELFSGFSKLNSEEKYKKLINYGVINQTDIDYLQNGGIKTNALAEKWIENAIGYFQLPMGVATNVRIDDVDYIIPMAVEETSIIAAVSKTAKWINEHGTITTKVIGDCIIGQMQCSKVKNFSEFSQKFHAHKQDFIDDANKNVAFSMVRRGGGVIDLELRLLKRPDQQDMAIIHLKMNSCDAMGANMINQVLEYLKDPIAKLCHEEVNICILSNLNDQKITTAKITMHDIPEELGIKLSEASLFAEIDPYRAATHNKGIMNGIDPIVIATGNDWRAIEAGVHAYAARSGRYQAISNWNYKNGTLTGKLAAPLIVGIVGGVTALHPTANLALKMMKIKSANHLSKVLAAVGLIQNLGAIKALCTDGIIKGHMKLHIDNLLLSTDANEYEIPILKQKLQQYLAFNKRVSLQNAIDILNNMRTKI